MHFIDIHGFVAASFKQVLPIANYLTIASDVVIIEVYLRKDNKTSPQYELLDNDKDVRFSAFMLSDVLKKCCNDDDDKVYFLSHQEIKRRYKKLQQEICLNESTKYKIKNLIKFVRKNEEEYVGIRTIL